MVKEKCSYCGEAPETGVLLAYGEWPVCPDCYDKLTLPNDSIYGEEE